MRNDVLLKYRKAEKRENPNALDSWLSSNCVHATSHEKLNKISEEKKDILKSIIDEDD